MSADNTRHQGYAALQKHSQRIVRQTLEHHDKLVDFWLSVLDFYYSSLESTDRIDINTLALEDKFASITRAAFSSLGIGHSSAALDATCRGDYHHAFFSIRFMAELVIQGNYLRLYPNEAIRWYPQHASPHTAPPKVATAFKRVKQGISRGELAQQAMIQLVNDCLSEANEWGAHPSQEILKQVMSQSEDRLIIGTRYEEANALAALDRGSLVSLLIIEDMYQGILDDSDSQMENRRSLWDRRSELMSPYWTITKEST